MKQVKDNFEEAKQRLGEKEFNELYGKSEPRVLEVVDEYGDEICTLQPFDVSGKIRFFKIWGKRSNFIEI